MNCKKCQTELEEGVTLCPNCGTENAGLSAGKIALLVVLAVAAVAVIAALLLGGGSTGTPAGTTEPTGTVGGTTPTGTEPAPTIPADGNPDDVTCKGTYTVTDDQLADALSTVVATVGEKTLTNKDLQIYYWMQVIDLLNEYDSYGAAYGISGLDLMYYDLALDLTSPLDTQRYAYGDMTWQQAFLDSALNNWYYNQAMCLEAEAAGFVLGEEDAQYVEAQIESLEEIAISLGYANADAVLKGDMGSGASMESFRSYLNDQTVGSCYYFYVLESLPITDADIEAYFDERASEYADEGLTKQDEYEVDVRHILITPEEGASDESAEEEANRIVNEWLANDPTEESFAKLANMYSTDPGSNTNGGLYEEVSEGEMVAEFNDWCFDASRLPGDYGIVKTEFGYHIMYFVKRTLITPPRWFQAAERDLLADKGNEFLEQILEKHPASIDYSAIALGFSDMGAAG